MSFQVFLFIFLAAVIILLCFLLIHNIKYRLDVKRQYDQLFQRYQQEVTAKLTQREEWLYNVEQIQSQLIFQIIDLLPEDSRRSFKRRHSDLKNRIESTRYYDNQLKIEQPILENDLIVFRNDLLMALQASQF